MPVLDLNKMKIESKWHNLRNKAKNRMNDVLNWVRNNPELATTALTVGSIFIGGAIKVGKGLVKTHTKMVCWFGLFRPIRQGIK